MKANRYFSKMTAIMLSITIILSIVPIPLRAENVPEVFFDEEIVGFLPLAESVANQTVPLGTYKSELNLPIALLAEVRGFNKPPTLGEPRKQLMIMVLLILLQALLVTVAIYGLLGLIVQGFLIVAQVNVMC